MTNPKNCRVLATGSRRSRRWLIKILHNEIVKVGCASEFGDALAEALEQHEFADTERASIKETLS